MKREMLAIARAIRTEDQRRSDLYDFAQVALGLLSDGIRQSRLADDIVTDLEAAAMARPLISEDIHQAHLSTRAAAPQPDQKGS